MHLFVNQTKDFQIMFKLEYLSTALVERLCEFR